MEYYSDMWREDEERYHPEPDDPFDYISLDEEEKEYIDDDYPYTTD